MNVEVDDFMLLYPKINEKNFQGNINKLAEFYNNKLEPQESLSDKKGDYLRHQEMARRLINNETPYSKMLFEHEPGTGKSCIITAISEWNITEKRRLSSYDTNKMRRTNENFEKISKRPIIFVANRTQEYSISKVIAKNCLPDKYINFDMEFMSEQNLTRRLHELVARDYRIETLQKFANHIVEHKKGGGLVNVISDDAIEKEYNGRLIIIDEAHHLRITNDKDESIMYKAFWRLLHVAKDIKVILLTGTPESDKAEDFAYTMNLILPEDEQLPIKNYNQIMFNSMGTLSEEGEKKLIRAVKGRVSYLRAVSEIDTKLIESGQVNPWEEGKYEEWKKSTGFDIEEDSQPWTRYTKLVPLVMSEFQKSILSESESKKTIHIRKKNGKDVEIEGVAGGAFGNFEKDASIFVWPDGTYGAEGFKKHIKTSVHGGKDSVLSKAIGKNAKETHTYSFKSLYGAEVKNNLQKYSVKFHHIIESLRYAIKHRQKVFIFSPHISGAGLTLLTMFMKSLLQYEEGYEIQNWKKATKKPRFITLSGVSGGTDLQMTNLLNTLNNPENSRGDYINCILGTEKISEGITLLGIRDYISFRADYRRKFILQAERRGFRLGSHIQLPIEERTYRINRLIVAQDNGEGYFFPEQTRDIEIYRQIESKDLYIKEQKRIRKIHCVDCVWNYARNVQASDKNMSNECDNRECNYICAESLPEYIDKSSPVWKYDYPEKILNFNNYNILYANEEKKEIVQELQILFQKEISYSYKDLIKIFHKHNTHLVLQTLTEIVDNNIIIYTRYGTIAYLHEENGVFFIDNMTSSLSNFSDETNAKLNTKDHQYTKNLYVSNVKSLSDLNSVLDNEDSSIVTDFCNAKTDSERIEILKKTSGTLLQTFVEIYFLTLIGNNTYEKKVYKSTEIKEFFNRFVYHITNGPIVHYLEMESFDASTYGARLKKINTNGKMRCLGVNGIWTYCSLADEKNYIKEIRRNRDVDRTEKFTETVTAYGKKHPDGNNAHFRLVRNIPMEVLCLSKNKNELIRIVGQLNIKFPEGNRETFVSDEYDVVQNDNISLMLGLLDNYKKQVCEIITKQLKVKKAHIVEMTDIIQNKLTKQEMVDLTIKYDITIKDVQHTEYPSLKSLEKLGYKGGELAPHIMRSVSFVYALWNQKKEKTALNSFKSSVKKHIETINTWYNAYNSKTIGSVCHELHKKKMIRTVLDLGDPNDMINQNMDRETMLEFINQNDTGFVQEELDKLNDLSLNTIVYIFNPGTTKSTICRYLYQILNERDLIFEA